MSSFYGQSGHAYPWGVRYTDAGSGGASRSQPSRFGAGIFGRLFRRIAEEQELRRDIRRLSELDDHMLQDIGIVRGDIEDRVRGRRS
jgi:uncharacterized protein YjiS (DUF1127 family)